MVDDHQKVIGSAVPSTPVLVSGWKELPEAGEQLLEVPSEVCRNVIEDKERRGLSVHVSGL